MNTYALVNHRDMMVVDRLQPLPEGWRNMSQLSALTDEELFELSWAGWENEGWVCVTDPRFGDYSCPEETLNMNKLNLKAEVQNQINGLRETLLKYKEKDIPFNDEVRTEFHILSERAKDLPNSYFLVKMRFEYFQFTGREILEISDMLELHNQNCNMKEYSIFKDIEACQSLKELTEVNYDI